MAVRVEIVPAVVVEIPALPCTAPAAERIPLAVDHGPAAARLISGLHGIGIRIKIVEIAVYRLPAGKEMAVADIDKIPFSIRNEPGNGVLRAGVVCMVSAGNTAVGSYVVQLCLAV